MKRHLPADDDPAFQRWLSDMESAENDLDPWWRDLPVVAALILMSAVAAVAVALGWTIYVHAAHLGIRSVGALVLMITGTGLVLTGGIGLLVGYRRSKP